MTSVESSSINGGLPAGHIITNSNATFAQSINQIEQNSNSNSNSKLKDETTSKVGSDSVSTPKSPIESTLNQSEIEKQSKLADDMTPIQCIHYACELGNLSLIRRAYDAGANINAPDNGKLSMLQISDENQKPNENTTQNTKDNDDDTSLLHKIINKIKSKNDNSNDSKQKQNDPIYKDEVITGDYPIHKAVNNNHLSSVELLFFLQADIEVKNRIGSTPLHRAVSKGNIAIIEFLLSKGSKIDSVNAVGNTPFHIASYSGNNSVMMTLIKHAKSQNLSLTKILERTNNSGMSIFDYAKKRSMIELLNRYKRDSNQNQNKDQINKQPSFSLDRNRTEIEPDDIEIVSTVVPAESIKEDIPRDNNQNNSNDENQIQTQQNEENAKLLEIQNQNAFLNNTFNPSQSSSRCGE